MVDEIRAIQKAAREDGVTERPRWPMIVLRTPKGWTGPKEVDGKPVEGTWRSHQVPFGEVRTNAEHRGVLEAWMRSYRPEELFDEDGALLPEIAALAPKGDRRMSANPHANGGCCSATWRLPDFRDYAVDVPAPGAEHVRGHARAGHVPARRHAPTNMRQLPRLRPRRDRLQPPRRRVRGHRPRLGGRDPARRTTTSPPTAA